MLIYKQYNEEQLNNQYNIRLHVPEFAVYFEHWEKLSKATREKYSFVKDIRYGDHERECLDVFPSAKPNSKTLVYIHGGYWHLFDKSKFHFIADAFHDDDECVRDHAQLRWTDIQVLAEEKNRQG